MKVVALSVVTLALDLIFGLTAAQATRTVRIASHVSIKGKALTFSGRVTSRNAACERGRKVTLHRTNGNVLGSTTTNSTGRWKITATGPRADDLTAGPCQVHQRRSERLVEAAGLRGVGQHRHRRRPESPQRGFGGDDQDREPRQARGKREAREQDRRAREPEPQRERTAAAV